MVRVPKSPQKKKELALEKDHFTFAKSVHGFRKEWGEKKAVANRTYRRKSDKLLAQTKLSHSADEAELIVGDITAKQLKHSIAEKPLQKSGTVSLAEKIHIKLERREASLGRKVSKKRDHDVLVHSAIGTLVKLEGQALIATVVRIGLLLRGGDPVEWARLSQSPEPVDRAIFFVEQLARGNGMYLDALRRDSQQWEAYQQWAATANRILAKQNAPAKRKVQERVAAEKKIKTLQRAAKAK